MKQKFPHIKFTLILLGFISNQLVSAQTVGDLISEVDTNSLDLFLNEFSGEVSTTVNNTPVTIRNRVSQSSQGNDLAADYLVERFNSFGNLVVNDSPYSGGGRNVVATQVGQTNPDDIYIICGHYDSVADYCADDNATSTSAILEIARILSQYCIDNTIIYALWDEEERGLIGSRNYANNAANNDDNILGVINMDMIGYDKDQNDDVAIQTRNIANSQGLVNGITNVLNTHSSLIGLTPNVVNPGIEASDHSSFWDQNYSAIALSEAATFSDLTPYYHTSNDRVSTLDLPYFHKISKLGMGIIATLAGLVDSNSCSLSITDNVLEDISIYPNPFFNVINVSLNEVNNSSIQVTNVVGQVIMQQDLRNKTTQINLQDLSKGLYFIKVSSNNKTLSKKIIKE